MYFNFLCAAYLVVGDNSNSMDPSDLSSSQTSIDGRGRSSRFKIMTVKRGFSREGDDILDYVVSDAQSVLQSFISLTFNRRKVYTMLWRNSISSDWFSLCMLWVLYDTGKGVD